jgi:hypothetical protein
LALKATKTAGSHTLNKQDSIKSAPADVMGELMGTRGDISDTLDGILDPRRGSIQTQYDIMDIIEKNEKMNEVGPEKLFE